MQRAKPRRYQPNRWSVLKRRILSRPVIITDDERRCVECEVRALEELLTRYRASQSVR